MRPYLVFNVTITGPAIAGISGATSFNRKGTLYLTNGITTKATAGDLNAVDFSIESGSPAGSPDAGAIVFATNSEAVRAGSRSFRGADLDLATAVKISGSTITVTPYTVLTRQYLYFTARRSLTASLYQIESGTVTLTFNAKFTALTSGSINLSGRAAGYPSSKPVTYKASITGQYAGQTSF